MIEVGYDFENSDMLTKPTLSKICGVFFFGPISQQATLHRSGRGGAEPRAKVPLHLGRPRGHRGRSGGGQGCRIYRFQIY